MDAEILLECALDIGEQMLISGAEISRVEDSIGRICRAYGAVRIDVFTITSCIIATVKMPDDKPITQTRRIKALSNDLAKLDRLNDFSRHVCAERPAADVMRRDLSNIISGTKSYSFWQQSMNFALVSSSFSIFFGGSWADAIVGAFVGIILKWLTGLCERYGINSIFANVVCSLVGGYLIMFAVTMGWGDSFDKIAIGNIMLLIPGIALTNSIRDMIGGDTVSGILRLCNALLNSVAIAVGFAIAGGML